MVANCLLGIYQFLKKILHRIIKEMKTKYLMNVHQNTKLIME